MNTHGIIATDWMLRKRHDLRAIVLPLVPEPKEERNAWVWAASPINIFWFKSESVGQRLLNKLQYQVGDRIYLQEPSIFHPKSQSVRLRSSFSEDLDDLINWVPAGFLAEEDSLYRFDVTEVKVLPILDLSLFTIGKAALFDLLIDDMWNFSKIVERRWNDAHPKSLWDSSLWVIVLSVELVEKQGENYGIN